MAEEGPVAERTVGRVIYREGREADEAEVEDAREYAEAEGSEEEDEAEEGRGHNDWLDLAVVKQD